MRNTTKAIAIILIFILTIGSCQKETIKPAKIDLGVKSTNMKFNSPAVQIGEIAVFTVSVTPGSKYSIQITDINGDVKLTKGILADNYNESISLDVSKISVGAYDLIFIDVQGNEIKQPLIIKQ